MRSSFLPTKKIIMDKIWEQPVESLPVLQRTGIIALRIVYLLVRDLYSGQLTLRAMGLVYTTLLALIPLLAVGFSVLKGLGVHNKIEPILLNFLAPLGDKGEDITTRIIGFVENVQAGVLGAVGSMLLFYTVVSLLRKVEEAFNDSWHVKESRPFSMRIFYYVGIVVFGPVLLFTAVTVSASISNAWIAQKVLDIKVLGFLFDILGLALPYILVVVTFTLIYKLIPNANVKFTYALLGALVAGLLWQATGWGFAMFVVNSAKYAAIYSAFATLVLFMIWLHISWLILLVGASIAFYSQHPEYRRIGNQLAYLSDKYRLELSLTVMSLVGQHFYRHEAAWTINTLAKELNIYQDICESIVLDLESAGLLIRTTGVIPEFLPAYALESMRVLDIIDASRSAGEGAGVARLQPLTIINPMLEKLEFAMNTALGDLTLLDLSRINQSENK